MLISSPTSLDDITRDLILIHGFVGWKKPDNFAMKNVKKLNVDIPDVLKFFYKNSFNLAQ